MTLEQRIEALEKKVANLTMPNGKAEELAKMMQDTVSEVIRNAQRPGGVLHKSREEAAKNKTAGSIQLTEKDILVKLEAGITTCRLSLT